MQLALRSLLSETAILGVSAILSIASIVTVALIEGRDGVIVGSGFTAINTILNLTLFFHLRNYRRKGKR